MTAAHGRPPASRRRSGGTLTLARAPRRPRPAAGAAARGRRARSSTLVERSGLRGRGGAHVSTALKLRAVASRRRRAIVVGQRRGGRAGEPQGRVLLAHAPHLVIDGAVVAARAVGADEAILVVKASDRHAWRSLDRALAERSASRRGPKLALAVARPHGYVSGQETAVIAHLNGRAGAARRPSRRARSSAASGAGRRSSATSRRSRTWR